MISGMLGECRYVCLYVYMYEVGSVWVCFQKNREGQFAWDWCTAHRSASRSNTIRLLKPCLSPLYVWYNGTTPSSKHVQQIAQLHRWLLNIGFTGEAEFLETNAQLKWTGASIRGSCCTSIFYLESHRCYLVLRWIRVTTSGRRASCPLHLLCFLDFGRPCSILAAREAGSLVN